MVQFTAIVFATAALFAGANAAAVADIAVESRDVACEKSVQTCGWYILTGSSKCTDEDHLKTLNPTSSTDSFNAIYETDPTGYVWRWVASCPKGCTVKQPGVPETRCN
ncbi:hypothetical protein B0H63DRAFT_523859 [Podospora didyma]|uniref:Small secreted protein n=1 Tax=Podospora didyma TaxID=330526 RepID=A0AAE0TVJ9_9PEZI|nr:hypothetical protein B0H63DRAFT_523859 [Podospora didyma]